MGFVVLDIWPIHSSVFEIIRFLLSSALKRALLVEQLKVKDAELEERASILHQTNKELENIAYVASNDLQEPLRMVISYLSLIEKRYKGKLDSDADEFIGFAVDGASRMQRLINDLLIYSRVGSQKKSFEKTNLAFIMEQVRQNLKVAIDEHQATVVTQGPMPIIIANPGQILQLFQNLIGNGIKFHGNNLPEVCINAIQQSDGWLFSVRDNGIGLDMYYAERIFLIFQRLHNQKDYPGTGIGLSVCKKIVEQHGGRIWVESEPGKGATFYFTIPRISNLDSIEGAANG